MLGVVAPLVIIALSASRVTVFGMVMTEALFGNAAVGLVMAMAMEQVGAEVRSTAAAVLLTSMHLLGDFISWPLVGAMSTTMAGGGLAWLRDFAMSVGVRGGDHLSIALVGVSVPVALLASMFYLVAARLTKVGHEITLP